MRHFLLLAAASLAFAADVNLPPQSEAVIQHITAVSLRGRLSFIASDALEGRATPSPGLDIASEYIASEFRRDGLEPLSDGTYFQTATLMVREPNWEGFRMTLSSGGKTIQVDKSEVSLPGEALDLENVPVIALKSGTPEMLDGKIVVVSDFRAAQALRNTKPALILSAARQIRQQERSVVDPEAANGRTRPGTINKPELTEWLASGAPVTASIHLPAPHETPAKVHNVAGILRGSDPTLKDTYVMVTAHYDHLGTRPTGDDHIFNGANDDGSGTVSVVELASALSSMSPHPKRSILFMTFFGEELGLVGSRYYGRHPLVPFDKTIADLNLEQVGRTDASNGPQLSNASITGYDFSDMPKILADAAAAVGVKVYKDPQRSDPFFARSDNQALADMGVPAHTICVAFEYPDYHGAGDEWPKVDYDNMAKVDRAVALGLLHLASGAPPPKWNESLPAAQRYVEAAKKLNGH